MKTLKYCTGAKDFCVYKGSAIRCAANNDNCLAILKKALEIEERQNTSNVSREPV